MQDLLHNFGVNGFLLTAQIVNFLIVLYVLKRFALKPILQLLDNRRKIIAESIKNAEETQKLLAQTEEREKEILKKAQVQAQEILADTKKQAVTLQQDAEITTKNRIERMLQEATKKIEEQTKAAEKELASKTAHLSVEILEKSLEGFFDVREQKAVIEKATKRIKSTQ